MRDSGSRAPAKLPEAPAAPEPAVSAPVDSEPAGDGKTDHPGTDHDAIHFIHAKFESSLVGGPRWRRISPPGTRSRSIALAHYRVVWDDLSGDPRNFFMAGPKARVPVRDALIMSG